MMKQPKLGKLLLGTSLSLSILLSGGTALLMPQAAHAAAAETSTSLADQIFATGKQFLGVPYKFGSKSGVTSTFDCSSFTQYVYKQNGISLPRDSRQQSTVGTYVPRNQLKPGDLIFFYSPIHHVAIYIGNGQILHTYGKPGVTISNLSSWESRINTIRRVLPDNGQAADTSTNSSTDKNAQPATNEQTNITTQPASNSENDQQAASHNTKHKYAKSSRYSHQHRTEHQD